MDFTGHRSGHEMVFEGGIEHGLYDTRESCVIFTWSVIMTETERTTEKTGLVMTHVM